MAYLVKNPKSKYWFAVWRDAKGKQIRRSTRATDRKTADRVAREYEAASLKQRTARKAREVIASLHRELTGDDLAFPTVREYIAGWLDRKGPETSEATLNFYKKSTKKFLEHLGAKADAGIDQVTAAQIVGFRNAQSKAVASKTANHDLKAIRMLFKSARKEGVLFENPAEDVEGVRKRTDEEGRRPFTIPELQAVMSAADEEWKSMVSFGLFTGMRLADVAVLTWSNVDLPQAELRYRARKTGKTIILPLAGPLADHVASLTAPDDPKAPLHPRAYDSLQRTGKSGTLSNWFADLLADAGLRERKKHHRTADDVVKGRDAAREKSELSFHSLRHTMVSLLKNAGVPASTVMAIAGHSSAQVSAMYTHVDVQSLTSAAEKMPKLVLP